MSALCKEEQPFGSKAKPRYAISEGRVLWIVEMIKINNKAAHEGVESMGEGPVAIHELNLSQRKYTGYDTFQNSLYVGRF